MANPFNVTKIHTLDLHTSNQIAAGEVVERPCSVVKELVENSIDAKATRITVRIKEAGLKRIVVADNGLGMVPEDLMKSVQRYATSKIRQVDDLNLLTTLGFRGEALAAIAAVSYLTLVSTVQGAVSGYQINVENGKPDLPQAVGASQGTTITVNNLFYNTPARKKFLKSNSWEVSQISDYVGKLAISNPQIAFNLYIENKCVLSTTGSGEMNHAILAVYGKELIDNSVKVEWLQTVLIDGIISLPALSRPNRNNYLFFINNRWIKSSDLSKIVDEAYYTYLPVKRYPVVILNLSVAPSLIDINVHPSKLEVKFKDFEAIRNNLLQALKEALTKREKLIPPLGRLSQPADPYNNDSGLIHFDETAVKKKNNFQPTKAESKGLLCREAEMSCQQTDFYRQHSLKPFLRQANTAGAFMGQSADDVSLFAEASTAVNSADNAEVSCQQGEAGNLVAAQLDFTALQVLGQIDGTYIVTVGEDCLYFIDQHAAHERILYEQFKAEAQQKKGLSNLLAVPLSLELTYQENIWLVDAIMLLTELGFLIEHFGDNTFLLRGVPLWYSGNNPELFLRAIIAQAAQGGKITAPCLIKEEDLFMMACKSAVKGNNYLSEAEINNLLRQLNGLAGSLTCPHGRPLIIKLTFAEIRKRFLRSGI